MNRRNNSITHLTLSVTTCLLLMSCLTHAENDLVARVNAFTTDRHYLYRVLDTQFTTSGVDRIDALCNEWARDLDAIDFDALNVHERIDWLLLDNLRASQKRDLIEQREEIEKATPFFPFAADIVALNDARRKGQVADGRTAAKRLAAIREAVSTGRKAFDAHFETSLTNGVDTVNAPTHDVASTNAVTKVKDAPSKKALSPQVSAARHYARETSQQVNHLKKSLEHWYNHYSTFQPDFKWWVEAEWEQTKKAFDEYHKHLREKRAAIKGDDNGPLLGRAIGETRLNALIHEEMIAYDARELLAIGERELAWCEAEMAKVAEALGEPDWTNVLARVKDAIVPPGEQAQLVSDYVKQATAFVKDNALLDIPSVCEESWRIDMVSKDAQKQLPYALYSGQNVKVAYATRGMTHDAMQMSMRGNNLHATRIVVAHEIIPGHHYQQYMASKSRPYRGRFRSPFLIEGWALYWEMRLWDLDFARNAEDRAGMLFWRAHRCARIILTLKYHLGEMQPEAMVDMLVERIGHERDQATAEVRRYINPNTAVLYQVSYMIGGLQLKSLWTQSVVEGGMSEIEFHNAVLRQGPIPIEMIRAALLRTKLPKDYSPQWRF